MRVRSLFKVLFAAILLSGVAAGPSSAIEPPLTARLVTPSTQYATGKSYPILVEIAIRDGFHINSNAPLEPALIPTVVKFTVSDPNVTIGRVSYPEPILKKFKFAEQKLSVYEGIVYISTSISLAEGAKGPFQLKAHLGYQACTEVSCMIPAEIDMRESLTVGTNGVPLEAALFARHPGQAGHGEKDPFAGAKGGVGLTTFLLVFFGGLALNLTPCVYPLIPVTIGYFGAAAGRTRRETATHAIIYLLGMALMYSALGVVAALTGSLFGALMQNTVVILVIVAIMLSLAASMFGAFDIIVPASLVQFSTKSYGGYLGTLFMGLTVGILAAPCVGPFVIGLLTFVGEKQDPLLGFFLFFFLALGLGLPFVALAIFSGLITNLPRSGVWMVWVKKVFGVVLVGMAVYFARPLVPTDAIFRYLAFAVAAGGGGYLLYSGRGIGGKVFKAISSVIALGAIGLGVWLVLPGPAAHEGMKFREYSKESFSDVQKNRRPAMIDFTADWCLPCRELKAFTFSDARVLQRVGEFEPFTVDLTKVDEAKLAAKKDFNVLGVPTVILFNSEGREVDRFTGFITADEFLKKLDALKSPAP